LLNAKDFVEYLLARAEKERVYSTNVVNTVTADARDQIRGAAATVEKAYEKYKLRRGGLDLKLRFPSGSEFLGTVSGTQQYGVFVRVDNGPKGLIYYRNLPEEVTVDVFQEGMRIKVKVDHVEEELGKLSLHFVEFVEPSTL
jgi:polyribonucleotide nucleotidyltransferase